MLRMTTGQVSTRYISAAVILLLLLAFGFRHHDRISSHFREQLQLLQQKPHATTCPDDVRSTVQVTAPWGVNPQMMRSLWYRLETQFKESRPVPDYLEQPPRPADRDPVISVMREEVLISESDGASTRELHAKLMASLPEYPADLYKSGRGVVTLAGKRYSEFAATSLGMLRELGSRLPVEIWVVDEFEEMHGWCQELAAEGMACRRLSDFIDTKSFESAYQYKVFTLLFSGFEEVIFMDADCIPLHNLDLVFESEAYNKSGVVLWPDYWESISGPHTPYLLGVSDQWVDHRWYKSGTVESGQIMWDKKRHWKSLLLAAYYNYHGPSFYYTLFSANFAGWGDKETFPFALYAANEPFYKIEHEIQTVFQTPNSKVDMFHGIGMVQADPRNHTAHNALFLHCNIIKWSMRDFFCDGCRNAWAAEEDKFFGVPPLWKGRFENPDDDVYENLHANLRIFRQNAFDRDGLDPEPLLWKAMEHTACKSKAWGNEQVCGHVRRYMRRTFGFRFTEPNGARPHTSDLDADAWDTATSPDLCVGHPLGWYYFDASRQGH